MNIKIRFEKPFCIALILSALLLGACGGPDRPKESSLLTETKTRVTVPDFMADSAYHHIKAQVEFGPRVPNTPPTRNVRNTSPAC